jgi:hypothetical protein
MNREYCINSVMARLDLSDQTFCGLMYKLNLEILWSSLYEVRKE